jgi:hypothetical protein
MKAKLTKDRKKEPDLLHLLFPSTGRPEWDSFGVQGCISRGLNKMSKYQIDCSTTQSESQRRNRKREKGTKRTNARIKAGVTQQGGLQGRTRSH